MTANKPCYNVEFWEYIYDKERAPFIELIHRKARHLKALEGKDLSVLADKEAMNILKRINSLSEELNVLYGFLLFTDEMKNCYQSSLENIYDTYQNKINHLETLNFQLKKENQLLHDSYLKSINTILALSDLTLNKSKQNGQ
jgi:hypothetical protein